MSPSKQIRDSREVSSRRQEGDESSYAPPKPLSFTDRHGYHHQPLQDRPRLKNLPPSPPTTPEEIATPIFPVPPPRAAIRETIERYKSDLPPHLRPFRLHKRRHQQLFKPNEHDQVEQQEDRRQPSGKTSSLSRLYDPPRPATPASSSSSKMMPSPPPSTTAPPRHLGRPGTRSDLGLLDPVIKTVSPRRTPYYPPNASLNVDRTRVFMNRGPHYIANWTPFSTLPREVQLDMQRTMTKFTAGS